MTSPTVREALEAATKLRRKHIHHNYESLCEVCELFEVLLAALATQRDGGEGFPRCPDCTPSGPGWTPCVRHGGCEHGITCSLCAAAKEYRVAQVLYEAHPQAGAWQALDSQGRQVWFGIARVAEAVLRARPEGRYTGDKQ